MSPFRWPRFLLVLAAILALSLPATIALADDDKPDPGAPHVDDPPALYTYTVTRPAHTFDTSFGNQLGSISGCDDCAQPVTLPFTFNFYGYNYTTAYVSSNGLISFSANDPTFGNSIFGLQTKVAIAPLWDDWDSRFIGEVRYRSSPTEAVFTWKTQHFPFSSFGSNYVEFQAVLYSDGRIQANYRTNTHPTWTTATVGISTADTNVATAYAVNINSNTTNMASYLFTPGGQANQPPTGNPGGPYTVPEGGSVGLSGSGSDPDNDPLTYAWDLDNNGTFETGGQNVTFSAAGRDGPSSQTVVLRVCDNKNACGTASTTVNITNVAPTATFNAPASVNEGSPIIVSLSAPVEPSPADVAAGLTYAFDCGSGYGAYGAASSASCPTTDNGTRTVKGKVRDKDGGESEYSASVTINNVAPAVSAGADAVLYSGQSLSVSAGFTDPGVNDAPWSYTIDWNDGPASSGSTSTQGAGVITGAHQYFVPGTYTVKVCVTDKDNGKGCDDLTVEVKRLVVRVDIKPGSDPNSINLRSRGNVPVGILGGTYSGVALDATTIVRSTVVFAGAAALSIGGSPQDVNGDGRLDVVYHFDTQALNLTSGSTQGCLTGRTSGNVYFEGCDSVRIVQAP